VSDHIFLPQLSYISFPLISLSLWAYLLIFVFICLVYSYQQYFDLEGESGIVVRGIGTAVVLTRVENLSHHQHIRQQQTHPQRTPKMTTATPSQASKHSGASEE